MKTTRIIDTFPARLCHVICPHCEYEDVVTVAVADLEEDPVGVKCESCGESYGINLLEHLKLILQYDNKRIDSISKGYTD